MAAMVSSRRFAAAGPGRRRPAALGRGASAQALLPATCHFLLLVLLLCALAGQIVLGVQRQGLRPAWPPGQLPQLQELYEK